MTPEAKAILEAHGIDVADGPDMTVAYYGLPVDVVEVDWAPGTVFILNKAELNLDRLLRSFDLTLDLRMAGTEEPRSS